MYSIPARPWKKAKPPRRILAIRWQAMGDVMITLPYLQHLRRQLPEGVQLDLLTGEETDPVPRGIHLFDHVYTIGGGRRFRKQLFYTALLMPRLFLRRYDVVLDLQNNKVSRWVRRALLPGAWSQFDKYSTRAAGERTRLTIEAAGLGAIEMDNHFRLRVPGTGAAILWEHGWNGKDRLVVLNPAGFFVTRNWGLSNYAAFARLWLARFPDTRFLILGTGMISEKADFLQQQLGDRLINLVGKTTAFEAFAVLQTVHFMLSEDSGLMHMAWVSGIPTFTLFGGTRSDWARPLGPHSFFLDSSDLICGNCMQADCRFGDTRCLTRYAPGFVLEHALALWEKTHGRKDA
ncbi:MAG: glycosyltransferase family 9 protein [Bacteroidetes bacterium]|nr:glycosyltransferase family 9 protein [Bacteroidota bacterium]